MSEAERLKKVIFFTSPYSFEGSIINFHDFLKWAVDNNYNGVVLADTNWHGVIKFLKASMQFKDTLSCYIGYRIDDFVFVFETEDEIFRFINIYNSNRKNYKNLDFLETLKKNFKYLKISPCYYIPWLEYHEFDGKHSEQSKIYTVHLEAYKTLCNYLGQPIKTIRKSECSMEIDLREPEYTLKTFFKSQKLPRAPENFLEDLIRNEKLYKERLENEIKLIKNFNFEDYFYTIKRIVEVAKKNNIMIGPGRGSAVGSLVAYRLGITRIDPMKYDLMFERFLNEGRRDFPDIDIDVEDEKRQTLIELLKKEFGYVYNISTFASMPKKILESIPESLRAILKDLPIQRSTHAAGVIISLFPVKAPLSFGTETLEWDMEDLQQLGYIKFDILGLKTLSILKDLRQSLGHKKVKVKDLNNGKVHRLIAIGFTDNVFQLDSSLAKTVARDVAPRNINELAIAISLNRPGPIRAGVTQEIRNLRIKKEKKFNLDILSETYGLPIYQEQIMKIAMELAGFSSSQADALRKAIAKKDAVEMHNLFESLKYALVSKIGKEGIEIAKSILAFGEYAFNKSHAIAYAHLTEIMAYFKTNYPTKFYDIYLKHDTSVLKDAVYNLQALGYKVLPPRIKSFNKAVVNNEDRGEKNYFLPLYVIPGVSWEKSIELNERRFENFEDFLEKSELTISTVEIMIKIGVFDEIFESRRKAIQRLRSYRSGFNPLVVKIGGKLFGKPFKDDTKVEEEWEKTNMEYEVLGIALSLPTNVENKLASYSLAYALDLPYGIQVAVKAGYGTDGKSVFKCNIPDGKYTLVYPDKFEPGHYDVSYIVKEVPQKHEIIKARNKAGNEEIILPSGKVIPNARPLFNHFKTQLKSN